VAVAREWIALCAEEGAWADLDTADAAALAPDLVISGVARHWAGGLAVFLAECAEAIADTRARQAAEQAAAAADPVVGTARPRITTRARRAAERAEEAAAAANPVLVSTARAWIVRQAAQGKWDALEAADIDILSDAAAIAGACRHWPEGRAAFLALAAVPARA